LEELPDSYVTVEELFDVVERAIDKDYARLEVLHSRRTAKRRSHDRPKSRNRDQRAATEKRRRDPIVEEVREIRQEHARKFDHDPEAIFEDLKRYQKESEPEVVSFPPKRLDQTDEAA
jgi:hypothetical protein